jgi:hypothetical protein
MILASGSSPHNFRTIARISEQDRWNLQRSALSIAGPSFVGRKKHRLLPSHATNDEQQIESSMAKWVAVSTAALIGSATVLGMAGPALAAAAADLQQPHHWEVVGDIGENEEFWSNVGRYISYFFSVLLGTAYVAVRPVVELLRKPQTAVPVVIVTGLLLALVSFTVQSMLGMNSVVDGYEASSIVTPQSRN